MKYFIIIFLFCISTITPTKVHAGGLGGGATEITQLLNHAELLPMNLNELVTSVSTHGSFVKQVILDPIANALISSALEGASNDILSWVSGGFGGSDPLIIGDPESYIRNKGNEAVKGILDGIPTDSAFGDSIFNSLLAKYKGTSDVENVINELTKSNIPSLIQNNLCNDAKITSLSIDAVTDNTGSYNPEELAAKKTELWNYACTGDPNTDPQLAARLQDLNTQNPSIGGWDTWLATTGGENDYTRSVKAQDIAAQRVAEVKQTQTNEIYQGAGPVSEKECLKFDSAPTEGQIAKCLQWLTTTPGDQVGGTLTEALTAGTKRLENIMGDGSLTGMLQGFAISAITSGIKKALNASGGGTTYNIPVMLPTSRPVVQDLANDPLKKTQNLQPMDKQLAYYLSTLNNLAAIDSSYMSDLLSYEAKVTALKNCTVATSYYNNRMSRITPAKNSILAEQAKITEAKTLISDTQAKLSASNSSQEQSTIFNAYLAAIDDNALPTFQAEGVRSAEYERNKFDVSHDTELGTWQTTCAQQQNTSNTNNSSDYNSGNNGNN